jgi:uncharacterized membrane protein
MGFIIGGVSDVKVKNGSSIFFNLLAIVAGSVWMVAGYYAAEGFMYGNWTAPLTSIPGNLIQLAIGTVVAVPLSKMLIRMQKTFGRN